MSNYHATDENGANYPTKAALRRAVIAGSYVIVRNTSGFETTYSQSIADLAPTDVIVGPCPYTNRRWFANIKNGKVV